MAKSKTNKPRVGKKPGPKLMSKTQKEEVLAAVAKYDRRGYSQSQIADKLREDGIVDVSQSSISEYLQQLRRWYAETKLSSREELIREKVEQLKEVRREAWEAYERSKLDYVKRVRERAPRLKDKDEDDPKLKIKSGVNRNPDKGGVEESMRLLKIIVTREGRLPADNFLKIILQTFEVEARLQGLLIPIVEEDPDKAKPKEATDWETFFYRLANPTEKRVTVEATTSQLPETSHAESVGDPLP